jgi:DNA-binding IclR family transcriptional regulator
MLANSELTYSHVLPSVAEGETWIIKSAQRVLQVFEYFAEVRKPSSATEIANALGFPQSSASMLLRSLVCLGYLDYHREVRTFEPTLRLSLLGGWIPERIDVASHIIEILNPLHEEFNETVVLAEQYRNFVRYIYVLQRPVPGISYYIAPGTLRPVCLTATGRMLLTLNSEQDVLAAVHRTNAEEKRPEQWIKRNEFMETLAACRDAGFAYTERVMEDRIGVQSAVLLPAEAGARRLSVGVISELGRFKPRAEEIKARLLEIARG